MTRKLPVRRPDAETVLVVSDSRKDRHSVRSRCGRWAPPLEDIGPEDVACIIGAMGSQRGVLFCACSAHE